PPNLRADGELVGVVWIPPVGIGIALFRPSIRAATRHRGLAMPLLGGARLQCGSKDREAHQNRDQHLHRDYPCKIVRWLEDGAGVAPHHGDNGAISAMAHLRGRDATDRDGRRPWPMM